MVLATTSGLSQKQVGELKVWWQRNYLSRSCNRPGNLVIVLDNRYIDFEVRVLS